MVAIAYLPCQVDLTPASVSSHQVDIQCFHFNPPSEAAVSQPEVQDAKISKLQMAPEAEDILDKVDSTIAFRVEWLREEVNHIIAMMGDSSVTFSGAAQLGKHPGGGVRRQGTREP